MSIRSSSACKGLERRRQLGGDVGIRAVGHTGGSGDRQPCSGLKDLIEADGGADRRDHYLQIG